jgi:hypothetical protein
MFLGLLDPDPSITRQKLMLFRRFLNDILSLKTAVNVPRESNRQINKKKTKFLYASWKSWTKKTGSGSVNQVHVSKDSSPYQNVTDPEHCF